MKKYFIVFCVLSLISLPFNVAKAATDSLYSYLEQQRNPFMSMGDRTQSTNYDVGTCKKIEGGYWMQLPDGTWAEPNSTLNLCDSDGDISSWLSSSLNPWTQAGMFGNLSDPFGTNSLYPNNYGGYTNYNDYYLNCVLAQTLFANQKCQMTSQISYPWNSTYGGNLFLQSKIGNSNVMISSNSFGKDLSGIIGGYALYGILKNLFD